MRKIYTLILFFIIVFSILFNSIDIIENIRFSFLLCINNLFPSLIPFMILSNILINYNFIYDISDIFNKLMTRVFKVNKNCSFALIMSMLSGTPSNSKYLLDLLNNKLITTTDCEKALKFCHFVNPVFIIGTIGYTFLGNKKIGLIILISHYLSSFIVGIINRNRINIEINPNFPNKMGKNNFVHILTNSIISTTNTLLLILGIITTCLIITTILNNILNLNYNFKFIYGLIEVTQGLKYTSLSNLNINIKAIICSFLISFGGLCIHMQVFSIIDNKKIRYFPYFKARLLHGILSSIITMIFLSI